MTRLTLKTTSRAAVVDFATSLTAEAYDIVWKEMLDEKWARARFITWCGAQRSMDRFFTTVRNADKTKPCHIAYGDASFSSSMRGSVPAPTTTAFKRCQLFFGADRVRRVCEFRSTVVDLPSALSEGDTIRLVDVKVNTWAAVSSLVDGERRCDARQVVRAIRGLKFNPRTAKLQDRDHAPAFTILHLANCQETPVAFRTKDRVEVKHKKCGVLVIKRRYAVSDVKKARVEQEIARKSRLRRALEAGWDDVPVHG